MSAGSVVVIGASAGGIKALMDLAAGLPTHLSAAVLVVLHTSPYYPSALPELLRRAGPLPAEHAVDGESIEGGRIYVAPPDRHLLVRDGQLELSQGPRESHSRPAIDPLFRTAARALGPRVAGVILSGTQGDGSMGLMAIKAHGGTTIVQDPDESLYGAMARRAIAYAPVDHILPVRKIAELLVVLFARQPPTLETNAMHASADTGERLIRRDLAAQAGRRREDQISMYSCPECSGVLWQVNEGKLTQFRCHVGHTYSPELLLVEKSEDLETALWSAVRALVEKATLSRQLADNIRRSGDERRAAAIDEQAEQAEQQMRLIRTRILERTSNPASATYEIDEILDVADRDRQRGRMT